MRTSERLDHNQLIKVSSPLIDTAFSTFRAVEQKDQKDTLNQMRSKIMFTAYKCRTQKMLLVTGIWLKDPDELPKDLYCCLMS